MRRKNSKVAIVPLKGINTSTPDNTVEDGSCEVLHNMRIKDGAWRNVGNLKFIDSLGTYYIGTYEEARRVVDVLYKHPSASEDSYVVVVEVSHSGEVAGREIVNIANREISHTFFADVYTKLSVMHLGRLLILNIDGAMYYWRNTEGTGYYSSVSIPDAPTVTLGNKVMKPYIYANEFIQTKGERKVYTDNLADEFTTYLAPCPLFAYNGVDLEYSETRVYYPIFDANGNLVQPTAVNDWWQGEVCFFAVYKTVDGQYLRPSALSIIASELDNAGLSSDRTIPRDAADIFNYGERREETEVGLTDESITLNAGTWVTPSGYISEDYKWMDTAKHYAVPITESPTHTVGIWANHSGDSSIARHCIANALMVAPKCRITFVNSDPDLIDSVAIFATRIHSRWDAENLAQLVSASTIPNEEFLAGDSMPFTRTFADNHLPEQPFYKVLEIPRSEWGESGQGNYVLDVALTGSLLENAEQKEVWEPINPHELVYKNGKEINSMMHVFEETSQTLFKGYGSHGYLHGVGLSCYPEWPIATSLSINDKTYCVQVACGFDLLDGTLRKNIISYPDARAKQIYNGSATIQRNPYTLYSAISNNFAYYTADIFELNEDSTARQYFEIIGDSSIYYCKYPRRWKDTNTYIDGERIPIGIAYDDASLFGRDSVSSPSQLRVSALSNPLVFPLSRTYQIGSDDNQIIAINSAAIELSDEKIGEYPTWVFTKEGVFVGHWGEGDDVIYRAFLPRTYDRICNPNTLAVNGSILFITPQGLMSIGERGSQLLSAPLNSLWGKTPKWLVEAKILGWKYDTNEVFISGEDSDIYVLNLGAGLWSTRTKPAEHISKLLANRLLVGGDSLMLYSIQEDGDFSAEESVRILTRPIKMGAYEMKRIETLIARFVAHYKLAVKVTIYGSVDGAKWGVLRQANVATDSSIRLTHVPMSVRYFKLGLEFPSVTDVVFTSFDIEYYNRFINRLR